MNKVNDELKGVFLVFKENLYEFLVEQEKEKQNELDLFIREESKLVFEYLLRNNYTYEITDVLENNVINEFVYYRDSKFYRFKFDEKIIDKE